jgi:hypothetical protein
MCQYHFIAPESPDPLITMIKELNRSAEVGEKELMFGFSVVSTNTMGESVSIQRRNPPMGSMFQFFIIL